MEDLALVYNIGNFYELNPSRFRHILEEKNRLKIEEYNQKMGYIWTLGRLVGLAVLNPKEYPKRPIRYEEQQHKKPQTKEENIKQWREFVERNRID